MARRIVDDELQRKRLNEQPGVAGTATPIDLPPSITPASNAAADAAGLLQDTQKLFRQAVHEEFEFGMENDFIRALQDKLAKYETKAVQAIDDIVSSGGVPPHVAAEALRWLGGIDHPESLPLRLALLEKSLHDPSRWVRDGAALGLDAMNHPHSIRALEEAVAREPIRELRRDMERVLHRLQAAA